VYIKVIDFERKEWVKLT